MIACATYAASSGPIGSMLALACSTVLSIRFRRARLSPNISVSSPKSVTATCMFGFRLSFFSFSVSPIAMSAPNWTTCM